MALNRERVPERQPDAKGWGGGAWGGAGVGAYRGGGGFNPANREGEPVFPGGGGGAELG